jgi:hypothetical protein
LRRSLRDSAMKVRCVAACPTENTMTTATDGAAGTAMTTVADGTAGTAMATAAGGVAATMATVALGAAATMMTTVAGGAAATMMATAAGGVAGTMITTAAGGVAAMMTTAAGGAAGTAIATAAGGVTCDGLPPNYDFDNPVFAICAVAGVVAGTHIEKKTHAIARTLQRSHSASKSPKSGPNWNAACCSTHGLGSV